MNFKFYMWGTTLRCLLIVVLICLRSFEIMSVSQKIMEKNELMYNYISSISVIQDWKTVLWKQRDFAYLICTTIIVIQRQSLIVLRLDTACIITLSLVLFIYSDEDKLVDPIHIHVLCGSMILYSRQNTKTSLTECKFFASLCRSDRFGRCFL